MVHSLKCEMDYYVPLCNGTKTFEVRFNDRDYHVGDILKIFALDRLNRLTGVFSTFEITYILRDERFLKHGYVVLGLKLVDFS